jgi:hypothetical protein
MTVTSQIQVIEDGPRNYVIRLAAEISGGDSEYFAEKIDIEGDVLGTPPSALVVGGPKCTGLSLEGWQASTVNVSVKIYWEGTPNLLLWSWPANFVGRQTFRDVGSIKNTATAKTGCILLTTDNYTDPVLDGSYALTLWWKKRYA